VRGFEAFFLELARGGEAVKNQIGSFFSGTETGLEKWESVLQKLSDGKGYGRLLLAVLMGCFLIICGLILERLFLRSTENLRQQLLTSVPLGKLQRLGWFFSRVLLEAIGVAAYILTTLFLFVIIHNSGTTGYVIVFEFLIVSYYFRVIMFAAKMIFSPASPALRLFPLQDRDAEFLYRWIVRITFFAAMFALPGLIFLRAGGSEALFNLFIILAGLSVTFLMIVMIWQSRQRVAEAICAGPPHKAHGQSLLRERFAKTWHFFAILYVAGAGTVWLVNVFLGTRGEIVKLISSLFLIPIFIGLDQWCQRLLKMASGELLEIIDLSGDEKSDVAEEQPTDKKSDIKHFAPMIRRAFRVALVAFLFFIMLKMWGIDLSIGRIFTRTAMSIVIVLLLGFIVWEFTKARIDRKLKEEMPDMDEDAEEGGAGGSRNVTLLLLLRKFILAVLLVMVSLIILSSLGVNIGPLIAGAGVVGLAIGFGAQTLVKDIIAGIFFLIDDAFRVGDYVETAGVKGMVEHISLRSLKLRHPRGMVNTIPFGDMGAVTNLSRDYIITKLDFRVRYDTDIDKVRKIIKKINKELAEDEEIASVLLDKIKSQGVRELDDSAMIMRVKFKTIPGKQFIVRRKVFKLMQEKFREAGIEFAHRNVTVYLPSAESETESGNDQKKGSTTDSSLDKKMLEAGAAAAIAIAQEDAPQETKQK